MCVFILRLEHLFSYKVIVYSLLWRGKLELYLTATLGRRKLTPAPYIQSVPRSKHSVSVIKTSQLMLYREIIAVCSEIHTKPINTLCGQNVELLNDKNLVVRIVTTRL